ncbi:MAG: tetratricopeptide repeat protein, partial [Gammaproteobacteria bacterium]|nr:tetratricopeptide repeat protein [Gammaproteobacteria bacterium]
MNLKRLLLTFVVLLLSGCATFDENGTIADLRDVDIEIADTHIDGGLEKAMKSYQQFLQQTPETAMTPAAIRRLADLNIEREYGAIEENKTNKSAKKNRIEKPKKASLKSDNQDQDRSTKKSSSIADLKSESTKQFEKRAASKEKLKTAKNSAIALLPDGTNIDDLETAGAKKAIRLYKKLLKKFPLYEHKDQVLYQLSRAYEEIGQIEAAMKVMNSLVKQYPTSRHFAEVQFRRAEYFFTRKKFLDAEDAYKSILKIGKGTDFYELTLYKQGWTFYKQDMYEDALNHFTGLLDHKVSVGYDFGQKSETSIQKRMDDTFRVISLSFSSLGGADSVISYFKKIGPK